ncbi:protein mono-ADP-ribosyltransferase PARP9 [Erpetoichthys calabaricus]|uniref:protein mono-ADP-ribosyltransferase PARP9 n=1 Tax=Erpetoichthys calabaricus TaxID=27687 RepID=UPI00223485E2|nr:protein mono-ADP-ribosyltransferase PARP9 [Erpetoichthys calabaricus]XP_051786509.1 protein mono-ADP-ribosyltransferase PARP9 [Erpetoichthys calabaricus]
MFQAKEESFQLPIPKDIAALLSENENLCQIFQQKFGCQTFVYSGDTRSNRNAAEVRYLKRLNNGITISVWKDDLTTHRVDAVVNAANDKLQHVGGLAYALALAGGSVIEKESKEIIHKQQKVNPGDAVVTSAGSLPCKKVIHAVGPIYKSYQGNEDINACFILEKAVETILNLCVKEGFKSVAIPALSSGIFQFPLPLCAKIIAESIRKWTSVTHSRVLLTDIHLVNNDDPTVTEMQKWCRNIFGPNDKGEVMIDQQLGNVTLVIKKGFIEKEQVDVIVNTISSDLDLTQGEISKAILREAGKQLQKDILLNRRISKDILRTAAFNMNCKEVYHVICSPWKGKKSEEALANVVNTCLQAASDKKIRSISFPAIGSGLLQFPKQIVANVIIDQIYTFANTYKGTNLFVNFVLYPGDREIFEAVEWILKVKGEWQHQSHIHENYNHLPSMPFIEFQGKTKEVIMEAKNWFEKVLTIQEKYIIQDKHIYYFGDENHQDLSVIQNFYNVSLKEVLRNRKATLEITGQHPALFAAALAVESICCRVHKLYAEEAEEHLQGELVQWHCTDCPAVANNSCSLEKAYLSGNNSEKIEANGHTFNISFSTMTAEEFETGRKYTIERQALPDQDLKKIRKSLNNEPYQMIPVDEFTTEFKERMQTFKKANLEVLQIQKIENPLLKIHFDLKKENMDGKEKTLYQCVPAKFCSLVCRAGFQKVYSQTNDLTCGDGIYFSENLTKVVENQSKYCEDDHFIYIFEARVATGKSTHGSSGLTIPPATSSEPLTLYDSVTHGASTHVIFNSAQAYPLYLITCSGKQL